MNDPPVTYNDAKLSCCFSIRNAMVSYAAPKTTPEVFSSVEYRVTRASGSKPGDKGGVPPRYRDLGLLKNKNAIKLTILSQGAHKK